MENKDSKNKVIPEKAKKQLLNLWPFAKKEKPVYNLKSISIPRTSGRTLKLLVSLLRTPGIRLLLIPLLLKQAGLSSLRKSKVKDYPVMEPNHPVENKITSAAAKKSIAPDDLANPAIYPTDDIVAKCEALVDVGDDARLYDEAWTQVNAG